MKQYLGVDGGGTSTSFVLFDENGQELVQIEHSSLHFMSVNYKQMQEGFQQVKNEFINQGYNPDSFEVVMGLGGYGSDMNIRKNIEQAVLPIFPQATIMSDSQFAMMSGLNGANGIYLISGTGSIAMYNDGINIQRQGGFGYQIGDEGSSFWIGKEILKAFTKQVDLREERTEIYTKIMEHFELDNPYEIIAKINEEPSNYRYKVASLGKLFSTSKDQTIIRIFKESGIHLSELANGFKINEETKVAFGGSVLLNNQIVLNSCIENLNDNLIPFFSKNRIEYAAYILKKGLNK